MEAEYISRPEQETESEREKPVLVDVSEERGSHERTRTDYCCKMAAPVASSNGSKPTSINIDELMDDLDADKSGKVSAQELMSALNGSGLDIDSVKDFIASIDKDGDGQLDKNELRAFFRELGH
ncbi:hypothetical protein SprV_0301320600 [Sparganum proliferum]